ncbi:prepilin peptidase [Luteimicrobium sp. NPDC057192]|uniref:prepilin peptidase n=1 Tax=Luteimicrobium sp. NPDC057192 TaxID=3346042 RepID=UPI0036294534
MPTTKPASPGDLTDTPPTGASVVRSPRRTAAAVRSEVAAVTLPATVVTAVALVLVGLAVGSAAAARHEAETNATATLVLAAAPALVVLALVAGPLTVIDVRTHRLPDALTLPGIVLGALTLGAAALVLGDGSAVVRTAVGTAVTAGFYALLARLGGLGRGDVKLAWLVGLPLAWVGWATLATGVLLAFLLGGLWSVGLLVTRRANRKTAVAFGPFMLAGALLAVVLTATAAPAVSV